MIPYWRVIFVRKQQDFKPCSDLFGQMVRVLKFYKEYKVFDLTNKQICPFAHYCKTYHSTKYGWWEIQKWCKIEKLDDTLRDPTFNKFNARLIRIN